MMISLSKVTWLELVWSGCCYRFTWSLKDSKSDTLNSTTSDVIQAKYFITLSQNCILRLKTARTYLYLHLNFLSRFIFNKWTIYCIFILCSRLTSQYSMLFLMKSYGSYTKPADHLCTCTCIHLTILHIACCYVIVGNLGPVFNSRCDWRIELNI